MLWQLLDQCPIAALQVNFKRGIFSGEHKLCNLQENLTGNHNSIYTLALENPQRTSFCSLKTIAILNTLDSLYQSIKISSRTLLT